MCLKVTNTVCQPNSPYSFPEINKSIDLHAHLALKAISVHGINLFEFPAFLRDGSVPLISGPSASSSSPSLPHNWVTPWLATIPIGILQEITLHIWVSAEEQLGRLDWPMFLPHLAGPPALQSLVIKLSGGDANCNAFRGCLRKHLQILNTTRTRVKVLPCSPVAGDGYYLFT